jgi:hypothetical protein
MGGMTPDKSPPQGEPSLESKQNSSDSTSASLAMPKLLRMYELNIRLSMLVVAYALLLIMTIVALLSTQTLLIEDVMFLAKNSYHVLFPFVMWFATILGIYLRYEWGRLFGLVFCGMTWILGSGVLVSLYVFPLEMVTKIIILTFVCLFWYLNYHFSWQVLKHSRPLFGTDRLKFNQLQKELLEKG